MGQYDFINLDDHRLPDAPPPTDSSFLEETAKAPARILGGTAAELGEAGQFLSGDRIGGGLRSWGEQLQARNAITPGFQAEHPIVSQVGQTAESVARMAPYIAGEALVSTVAPEVGVPGIIATVGRGLRLASRAALPAVMGASTGQQSYELGVQQGMSSDEALKASLPAAATSAAGMALMGTMGKAGRSLLPEAKAAEGGVVKSILNPGSVARDIGGAVLADTPVMVGTSAATAAAQQVAGITPAKKPEEILKDPKEWLSGALAGGMFGALHAVQRNVRDAWMAQAHEAIASAQPIPVSDAMLSHVSPLPAEPELPKTPAKQAEAFVATATEGLVRSSETGEGVIDAMHGAAADQAAQDLDRQVNEVHDATTQKADQFINQGIVDLDRGKTIDPGVAAEIVARGFEIHPVLSDLNGKPRQRFEIITREEAQRRYEAQQAQEVQNEEARQRAQELGEGAATGEAGSNSVNAVNGGVPASDVGAPGAGREGDVSRQEIEPPTPGSKAKFSPQEKLFLANNGFKGREIQRMTREEGLQRIKELRYAQEGGIHAPENRNVEQGGQPERQDGNSGGQAAEASGGDSLEQGGTGSQEPRLPVGAFEVSQSGVTKGIENANKGLALNAASRTDSTNLANHPLYDGSFPIARDGGLAATKESQAYQTNPDFRAKVDTFEQHLDEEAYSLWKQKRILEQALPTKNELQAMPNSSRVRSEFNVDLKEIWHTAANKTYDGARLGNIAVREVLQNSLDAVLVALSRGEIKKGRIDLKVERGSNGEGGITIEDNGIGMTAEDIRDRFLTLGDKTKNEKGEGRFGGFGMAKAVILGFTPSNSWKLWSRDAYTDSDITGQRGFIQKSPMRKGTKLESNSSDGYYAFDSNDKIYVNYTEVPKGVTVTFNGEPVKNPTPGRVTEERTFNTEDGASTINVKYYKKGLPGVDDGYIILRLTDPQTGAKLVQGVDYSGMPGSAILDLTTSKTPSEYGYPLSTSRNNLSYGETRRDITGFLDRFKGKTDAADRTVINETPIHETVGWKVPLKKLDSDPAFKSIANDLNAWWQKKNGEGSFPLIDPTKWTIDTEKGKKFPAATVPMIRVAAVYEAMIRLGGIGTGYPVNDFHIMDYTPEAGALANYNAGTGRMGFNLREFDYTLVHSPTQLAHYLKALTDHELNHKNVGPHNSDFAAWLPEVAKLTGTDEHWPIIQKMCEQLAGKTVAAEAKELEGKSMEEQVAESALSEPALKQFFQEDHQYELFNQARDIELFNPYESDEQRSLFEPFGDTARDAGGPGQEAGDQSGRLGGSGGDELSGGGVRLGELKEGEVRKLSENQAIAMNETGDEIVLGAKNPDGSWTPVARAEKNAKGVFEVDAAGAETPEAAARMVAALREVRFATGETDPSQLPRNAGGGVFRNLENTVKDVLGNLEREFSQLKGLEKDGVYKVSETFAPKLRGKEKTATISTKNFNIDTKLKWLNEQLKKYGSDRVVNRADLDRAWDNYGKLDMRLLGSQPAKGEGELGEYGGQTKEEWRKRIQNGEAWDVGNKRFLTPEELAAERRGGAPQRTEYADSLEGSLSRLENEEGYTPFDFARDVERLVENLSDPAPKLEKALRVYHKEEALDRQLKGRGDMDSANEALRKAVEDFTKGEGDEGTTGTPTPPLSDAAGLPRSEDHMAGRDGADRPVSSEPPVEAGLSRVVGTGPQENIAGTPDTERTRKIHEVFRQQAISRVLRNRLGLDIKSGDITISDPKTHQGLSEIGKVFGTDVIVFDAAGKQGVPEGFMVPGEGVIYLNAKAKNPAHTILGHEINHQMASTAPELYREMLDYLKPLMDAGKHGEYTAEMREITEYKKYSSDALDEEMIGNFVGSRFGKPGFWDAMAKDNPSLFTKIVAWVKDLIAKVQGSLGEFKSSEKIFTDLNQAEKVVQLAYTKYAEKMKEGKFGADLPAEDKAKFLKSINDVVKQTPEEFVKDTLGRDIDSARKLGMHQAVDTLLETHRVLVSSAKTAGRELPEAVNQAYKADTPKDYPKFAIARTPEESKEASDTLGRASYTAHDFTRGITELGTKAFRGIMAIDRTVNMARKALWAAPISTHLEGLEHLRRSMQQYGKIEADDAVVHTQAFTKVFKSDSDLKKAADVVYKSTLYQLDPHEDLAKQWSEPGAEWKPVENNSFTPARTLEEAKADLRTSFARLTEPQKQALDKLTSQVARVHEDLRNTTIEKLKAVYASDPEGLKSAMKAIDAQTQLKGRYFPLMRHGDIMVRTYEGEKEVKAVKYDTMKEANAAVLAAREAGQHAEVEKDTMNSGQNFTNVPAKFMNDVIEKATARGIGEAQLAGLKQDIQALWVNTLSPNSIEGFKLQRSGVEGFNTDVLRSFADYMNKEASAVARTKYSWQIADKYREMRQVISRLQEPQSPEDRAAGKPQHDPENLIRMQTIVNYLEAQDQKQGMDKIAAPVRVLNKLAFMTMLTSPTMWIAHMAQPLMFTVPKLAARFGIADASAAHYKFTKNWMSGKYSDAKIEAWEEKNPGLARQVINLVERSRALDSELQRNVEASKDFGNPEEAKKNFSAEAEAEKARINDALKGIYEGQKAESGQEYLVLRVAAMMGSTELSRGYDLHDLAIGASKMEQVMNKLTNTAGFFLRKGVSGARKAAATATFDLAYKGDFIKTLDYMTRDIVDDTLYNYDPNNRPAWMKTNTGRLVSQFQFFRLHTVGKIIQLTMDAAGKDYAGKVAAAKAEQQNNIKIFGEAYTFEANKMYNKEVQKIQTERHEARKELAYMTAVSMGLAGAAGAPITMLLGNTATQAAYNAIAWMFEDPNDPWSFGHDVDKALHDAVGDDLANVLQKGLPSLVGMDLSKRLGVGGAAHIVEGEPPEGMTAGERSAWYANRLLGPAWSMIGDWRKAGDAIAEGKTGDAVKYTSPNFVRNFFKAYDLENQGVQVAGKTVVKPEDVNMYEIALQLSGINPLDLSLAKEESNYLKNISTSLSHRRSGLIKDLAAATVASDQDAKNEATEKLNQWAEKQPKLKVTAQELATAIKNLKNKQEGKLTKREQIIRSDYGS